MRAVPQSLLALALFTACATAPMGTGAAAHAPATVATAGPPAGPRADGFAAAMARVRAQEPGAPAGRAVAQHIDQREPPLAGSGLRPFRRATGTVRAAAVAGTGTVAVRAPGTPLDDRTRAAWLRLSLDGAADRSRGAALHAQFLRSDDELFAGQLANDGVVPGRADAQLTGIDVFPHLRFPLSAGHRFDLPVRVGVFTDLLTVEHALGVDRTWLSVGPRILLEPSWRCLGDADAGLELVGCVGGGLGAAWLREEFRAGEDTDGTTRLCLHLGAALRGTFGRVRLELGYEFDRTWFGSTTTELYGRRSGTELLRQGVLVGGSIDF